MIAHLPPGLKPKDPFSCLGSVERALAQMSEHERANTRYPRQSTERRRDKRAQGAAQSVGCLCWRFPLIRQPAASARNVRVTSKPLFRSSFPHIAEADDG